MTNLILTFVFIVCLNSDSLAQNDVIGKWKTIDDETGKAKSIVELYMKDNELYGKIIELYQESNADPDPFCDACTDDRKDQKVTGMEILRNMELNDDEWEDGTICDPKNGKVYDCKLWLENNQLQERGYVAFFYRTQTWLRVN